EERFPDDLDVSRVCTDEQFAQQVVDDSLRHARRDWGFGLAPADDAGIRLDAHQAGVDTNGVRGAHPCWMGHLCGVPVGERVWSLCASLLSPRRLAPVGAGRVRSAYGDCLD